MRTGRDPVRSPVAHDRPQDRGVHPRAQILALEDRRDAADHPAARVELHRLAGERLPHVRRVVVVQTLRELDDGLRAGAAGNRAVDRVDGRVGLPERGEERVEGRRLGA